MQVVSLAPVPVASLKWRMGDGAWMLSVICKLTLQLCPGDAEIAKRHDPIHEQDRFPDDDETASLFAPSDLVPQRKLVDVMVVGNTYAPRGTTTTALRARLCVMTIDKRLNVDALDEVPFKSAYLGYEHAEAGPTNPIGTRGDAEGHGHRIHQQPDPSHTNPGFTSPGFGPIAAHWLSRRSFLRGQEPPHLEGPGEPTELPAEFDLGFFNAAPPDQQLPELPANAELVLEHLHPEHAVLRTRLPNVAAQFFVERPPGQARREEIEGRISALWIDTRRSVATLTFHGVIKLTERDERGRVWVAVAGPGRRLSASQLAKLIGSLSRSHEGTPHSVADEETTDEGADPMNKTVSIRKARLRSSSREDTLTSVLSAGAMFGDPRDTTADNLPATRADGLPSWLAHNQPGTGVASNGATSETLPPPSSAPAPSGDEDEPRGRQRATTSPGHGSPLPAASAHDVPPLRALSATQHGLGPASLQPEWPSSHRAPNGDKLAETSSLPLDPLNVASAAAPGGNAQGGGPRESAPPRAPYPPVGVEGGPPPGKAPTPTPRAAPQAHAIPAPSAHPRAPSVPPPPPPTRAGGSVAPPPPPPLGAPIATRAPSAAPVLTPALKPAQPAQRATPRRRVPDEVVELLWYDESATERLRRRWRPLCEELAFAPRDDHHDLATQDPKTARDHHTHFGVLTEGPLEGADGLRRTLREAISEQGRFTPPLALVGGVLRFPFDEVAVLRATHAMLKPIAGDDKKLKSTLTQVEELLASPVLSGSTDTVSNLTSVLRKRYDATRRTITLEYIDETIDRLMLEQRCYQKRTLFGAEQIRALLTLRGADKPVPTYLPATLANTLPMLHSIPVRVIAETHIKQDQYEQHPHALRVITLGRVIKVEA